MGARVRVSRSRLDRCRMSGVAYRLRRRRYLQFRPARAVAATGRGGLPRQRRRPRFRLCAAHGSDRRTRASAGWSGRFASRACRAAASASRRPRPSAARSRRRSTAGCRLRCSRRPTRYFGSPVVEIKQIASYSCRGRNGNRFGHLSEHAFGNALDIAGFRLANGEDIIVVNGWWRGTARGASVPAGSFRRRLRRVLHRARPGQRPLPLQPHPCRPARHQRLARTPLLPAPAGRAGGGGGRRAEQHRLPHAALLSSARGPTD